jgi:hypothetical protein
MVRFTPLTSTIFNFAKAAGNFHFLIGIIFNIQVFPQNRQLAGLGLQPDAAAAVFDDAPVIFNIGFPASRNI